MFDIDTYRLNFIVKSNQIIDDYSGPGHDPIIIPSLMRYCMP